MILLAGDIGGTHSRLALYDATDLRPVAQRRYLNSHFSSLQAVISAFLLEFALTPQACCLGVAGPVIEGRAKITNLPWAVESASLSTWLGAPTTLLNDLEATAYGVEGLTSSDVVVLQEGRREEGNQCVVSAGTGLGEAGRIWNGQRHVVLACEGGHASFAPTSQLEVELFQFLTQRFGHVSCERVISGQGLIHLYEFSCLSKNEKPQFAGPGQAHLISQAALEHTSPAAELALELFVRCYAVEASNLALKTMALGGVFLSGGIAPKILPKLLEPQFLEAFHFKGRMASLLQTFPIYVVTNEHVALRGAALYASQFALPASTA